MTATQRHIGLHSGTAELLEQIRGALSRRSKLRIIGGGTWLDAYRPVQADNAITTAALTDIVHYEPGDLTLTAYGGATLDAIAKAAAAHGQWLALDPAGDPRRVTIGATIATASYGPLAHHFGAPRDMTLGVEFVTGTGKLVRGGGRVVKNVAGFDLTRLLTGSWGSLGVVTEATVRLRALPEIQTTMAIDVGAAADQIEQLRRAFRALPFVPLAAQWLDARLTRALGVPSSGAVVLIRLGGNEEAVRAQRTAIERLSTAREVGRGVWDRLRLAEPTGATTLRLSRLPSEFAETWTDANRLVARSPNGYCHGDAGRGVVRCVLPMPNGAANEVLLRLLSSDYSGTRIFERLPATMWRHVPPAASTPLERRIKATYDPHGILNPGIFGET